MVKMTVNGEALDYRLDPATPLLWALRDASNLTGTKYGCDQGRCGACTVLVDGSARKSCQLPLATLEGADIVTIEGLGGGALHPLQRAWADEQVSLCGRCEPGLLMAAAGLFASAPSPSADAIEALDIVCPCGIAPAVRRALLRAAGGGAAPLNAPASASFTERSSGAAHDLHDAPVKAR